MWMIYKKTTKIFQFRKINISYYPYLTIFINPNLLFNNLLFTISHKLNKNISEDLFGTNNFHSLCKISKDFHSTSLLELLISIHFSAKHLDKTRTPIHILKSKFHAILNFFPPRCTFLLTTQKLPQLQDTPSIYLNFPRLIDNRLSHTHSSPTHIQSPLHTSTSSSPTHYLHFSQKYLFSNPLM